jgi:hypothetical protein
MAPKLTFGLHLGAILATFSHLFVKKKGAGPERPRKKGMQCKEAGTAGP